MNVAVIGTGYVGLVVGAGLADFGLQVTCVDSQTSIVEALQQGKVPIYEPGLLELVQKNVRAGRLAFSDDLASAVDRSLVIFVTVPTDSGPGGSPDLTALWHVGELLAETMKEYKVIVVKSTVPIGTAHTLTTYIRDRQPTPIPFDIISNPEFLREGSALETFLRPNRIVLGRSSEQALAIIRDLYRPFYLIETPFVITDNNTAEMIKYVANSFLALKISYINEVASLCDEYGCDVHVVAKALGMDPRIGPKFLHPGPGFGGNCLPRDTQALLSMAAGAGIDLRLLRAALEVNETQAARIVEKVRNGLGTVCDQKIAVLGLAFKSNTDDVRHSPALRVCNLLLAEGAIIRAHDPVANEKAAAVLMNSRVSYYSSPYEAVQGAAALLLLTEWNEFRNLDLSKVKSHMSGDLLVDARNIYEPGRANALGFRYQGVGRGNLKQRAAKVQNVEALSARKS